LTGNQIGCQGAAALAEALASNFSLQELILTKNHMGNDGAYSLALALGKPTCCIKSISWNDNSIAEEGIQALARVPQLRNNQKLWLGDTLRALAKGKISSVNFMNRVTGDEELLLLCDILSDNNPLVRSLWLSGRIATARGILPLIDRALPSPSNVERIYLKEFSIGDEIAASFGRVLSKNITLGVISITDCDMTETGAAALAAGLKHNSTLRRLQLDRNRIGDVGMQHLAGALPHPALVSLAACRNNISDRTMAVENLKYLQELHLNWNSITNTGALDFCKFLENGCELVYVSLRENAISLVGGETIQQFLPDHAVVEF
jgi:Ran GTPase-activating protein (RanGAP) involved in mRNA processing and transport